VLKNKSPLVLYHGHCMDGLGAAFAAWLHYGDSAEYMPVMHGDTPPGLELLRDRDVFVFDFAFPRAYMDEAARISKSFHVRDHHVHAAPLLDGTTYGVFDNDRSGAMLAWDFFFPEEPPHKLFLYLQDRDLWKRQLPHHEEITQVIRQHSGEYTDPSTLAPLLSLLGSASRFDEAVAMGRGLVEQVNRFVRNDLDRCWTEHLSFGMGCEIFWSYETICVTSTMNYVSELAHEMLVKHAEAKVSCVIARVLRDGKPAWHHSLRSRQGSDVDVGRIAKTQGGGGHKHSAGFVTDQFLGHFLDEQVCAC
jgi:oligoribonuclease NrnB/cAMP/cGMP phosphodiesterase (DHH superfamily)